MPNIKGISEKRAIILKRDLQINYMISGYFSLFCGLNAF